VIDPFEDLVPIMLYKSDGLLDPPKLYKVDLLSKIPTHSRFLDKIPMSYIDPDLSTRLT
jgi:hypothetical protein